MSTIRLDTPAEDLRMVAQSIVDGTARSPLSAGIRRRMLASIDVRTDVAATADDRTIANLYLRSL